MKTAAKIVALPLLVALGGCGLIYRYGDYKDAPDAGSGGASTSTTSTTISAGGSGGCTPPSDVTGDCQRPACVDGIPSTVPDDTDKPTSLNECEIGECAGGKPVYPAAPDKSPCNNGVCQAGACVQCLDASDCGGKCCLLPGNVCTSADPSCTDGCQDGNETGLDCGGDCTTKCPNGQGCQTPVDCESGHCDGTGHCSACTDGGNECGALCCKSGVCVACP